MLRCLLSSGRDRLDSSTVLTSGDNRDSPLHGEATRQNRCLRPHSRHCLCYGTIRAHKTGQAREGASNSGWQVVFDDEVTEV